MSSQCLICFCLRVGSNFGSFLVKDVGRSPASQQPQCHLLDASDSRYKPLHKPLSPQSNLNILLGAALGALFSERQNISVLATASTADMGVVVVVVVVVAVVVAAVVVAAAAVAVSVAQ